MSASPPTPLLCERCWFPVTDEHPVQRRMTPDGEVVLLGVEHADRSCTPQQPEHLGQADDLGGAA